MKKIFVILPVLLFAFAAQAQLNKDSLRGSGVSRGKTFGTYTGTGIIKPDISKPTKQTILSGVVIKVDWCEDDCMTIYLKRDDSTTVAIGTKDYGFKVPRAIVGRRISVDAITPAGLRRKPTQQNIQYAASGIKIIN